MFHNSKTAVKKAIHIAFTNRFKLRAHADKRHCSVTFSMPLALDRQCQQMPRISARFVVTISSALEILGDQRCDRSGYICVEYRSDRMQRNANAVSRSCDLRQSTRSKYILMGKPTVYA